MSIEEIRDGLQQAGYIAAKETTYAVEETLEQNIPLPVEGAPGAGKTCPAKAAARMMAQRSPSRPLHDRAW